MKKSEIILIILVVINIMINVFLLTKYIEVRPILNELSNIYMINQ